MKGEQQVPWGRETWRTDEGQELYDTKSVVRIKTEGVTRKQRDGSGRKEPCLGE